MSQLFLAIVGRNISYGLLYNLFSSILLLLYILSSLNLFYLSLDFLALFSHSYVDCTFYNDCNANNNVDGFE